MTFHGKPRMDDHAFSHVHESPWVVWLPLVVLAIPSVMLGYVLYMPMLFAHPTLLAPSLFVLPEHHALAELATEIHSPLATLLHALTSGIFAITLVGIALAYLAYIAKPELPNRLANVFSWPYRLLVNKYGFDAFNDRVFVGGSKALGRLFYRVGDQKLIDGALVNGTGRTVRWFASKSRIIQSGYLYHYIAVMVFGLFGFLFWIL